jgi:hypothetical protein
MRDDQTVAIAQHLWKIGRKLKMKMCPFPKIISARSGDAIRTELEWQERTTLRRIEFSEATPHRNPTAQQSPPYLWPAILLLQSKRCTYCQEKTDDPILDARDYRRRACDLQQHRCLGR